MSQPEGAAAPYGRPLRVVSERLGAEEVEHVRPTPAVTSSAAHAPDASFAATAVLPVARPSVPASPAALPVLAPVPTRNRFAGLLRLVFSRRRAGRHRPDTTPPHSWSMVDSPRRRPRRWGRR